jgi:Bacterial type II and III secretion system protein
MKITLLTLCRAASSFSARGMLVLGALLLFAVQGADAQNNRERRLLLNDYVAPEELISMSKTLPFDKAISLFTDFSKKYLNKIIVDPTNTNKEIGIDIENMYWLQAFENVLRANSLWYEEEYFQIINPQDTTKGEVAARGGGGAVLGGVSRDSISKAMLLVRDIKISTVFFEINISKSLNTGINWTFKDSNATNGSVYGGQLKSNLVNPDQAAATSGTSGSGSGTGQTTQPDNFIARIIPNLNFGNITGFVSFLEGNGLGDLLSSPQVIVSSAKKGQIQLGEDIFVTTKDFSGNVIQQRIATGIIVSVTPTLYEQNGVRFINLETHVEKSSQEVNGNISKNSIDTYLVLNDGEETVLGGLYSTQQTTTRAGIPFLRDLPWYVFGLRYIFGSEIKTSTKDELVILLKAEVVPTVQERLADKMRNNQNLIEKTRKEFDEDMAKRKPKSE